MWGPKPPHSIFNEVEFLRLLLEMLSCDITDRIPEYIEGVNWSTTFGHYNRKYMYKSHDKFFHINAPESACVSQIDGHLNQIHTVHVKKIIRETYFFIDITCQSYLWYY